MSQQSTRCATAPESAALRRTGPSARLPAFGFRGSDIGDVPGGWPGWPTVNLSLLLALSLIPHNQLQVRGGYQALGPPANYFTERCSGSEAGSYLRLMDVCIKGTEDVDGVRCQAHLPPRHDGWKRGERAAVHLQFGGWLRLIDCVYHSTLGLRVIKKKGEGLFGTTCRLEVGAVKHRVPLQSIPVYHRSLHSGAAKPQNR